MDPKAKEMRDRLKDKELEIEALTDSIEEVLDKIVGQRCLFYLVVVPRPEKPEKGAHVFTLQNMPEELGDQIVKEFVNKKNKAANLNIKRNP